MGWFGAAVIADVVAEFSEEPKIPLRRTVFS